MALQGTVDNNVPAPFTGVAALKTAVDLNGHLKRLKMSRSRQEMQWQLNMNFFNGRQYCYYSPQLNKIVSLPTLEGEKPRYRIRITSNQIVRNSLRLLAKATKSRPMFAATPGSADPSALKAAQVAEALAEHWWVHLQLARKYAEAFLLAIIMGSGFWFISYDKLQGEPQTFIMQPDPQTGAPSNLPFVNDALKDLFLDQLEQAGVDPEQYTKTIYPGEVRVEVLDPRNVYLDDSVVDAEAARWAIIRRHMDPVDIKNRWGYSFEPDSVPEQGEPLSVFTLEVQSRKSTKAVYCLYALPGPDCPKGRYVCWADDTILEDGPFPYDFGKLPLIRFGSMRHPLNPYGSSVVEHAIDDQKEYNRVLSKRIEFLMLTLTPRMLAPVGSIRGRVTNEPGQIIEYAGQQAPTIEALPSLPPYITEVCAEIKQRLEEAFFLNEIDNGSPPPNIEAGVSIDMLLEASADAFTPMILDNEDSISRALVMLLSLARKYYTEPRMLQITGLNGSSKLESFRMADMTPGTRIEVETGSSLPRSRVGKMSMVFNLVDKGLLPSEKALKYLDIPDMRGLTQKMRADEDQALREHAMIMEGTPLNPTSFTQAMQQYQQNVDPASGVPIDPRTNRPFQSAQEVEEYLKNAALSPHIYENTAAHLEVHSDYMKSAEYEQLPDHIKEDFEMHYSLSLDRYITMNPLPENVRVTHQIKSTVGPTAASQILTQAGVMGVTPEVMAEPPLETWVTDDVTKPADPNAQSAPIVAAAQAQAQMAQQQMQSVDQQQTAHEQRQQGQQAHEQQLVHKQNAHEQQMQHAAEAHAAKLKQMQQPKAPASGK